MHIEILSEEQKTLLPFLKKYRSKYYMVGGTAIAFFIGHRYSIDFDLFTDTKINFTSIKKNVATTANSSTILHASSDQIHFILDGVKLTFFQFPFSIEAENDVSGFCRIPDLLVLAAMKAFALNGRGKWKDYVDLYFIIKDHFSIEKIGEKAKAIFQDSFNPILFRKQICYFNDISYAEPVEFLPGFETDEATIKSFLTEAALAGF